MNNFIVATYLTSHIDEQRGVKKEKDDPQYIQKWAESIRHLGLKGVVLHDGLSEEFISTYPYLIFKKVDEVPEDMQLYDYRWVLYYAFVLNNHCNAVFFTDISDVQVRRNPFYEMEDNKLYCGDEPTSIRGCEWLQKSNESLSALPSYKEFLNSENQLLNCGIFGGQWHMVNTFLSVMVQYIERWRFRKIDGTVDMPIFNYIAWFYVVQFTHGEPVNSVFKWYQDRNDVWFIHK
jgi:hypothetical protein